MYARNPFGGAYRFPFYLLIFTRVWYYMGYYE